VWVDVYSRRIFPWTNVAYIHFPFSNHFDYRKKFPYLKSRRLIQVCAAPYVVFERNFVDGNGKLKLANSRYTAGEIENFLGLKAEVLYPPVSSANFISNVQDLAEKERENLVVTISRFRSSKKLEKIPYIASLTGSNTHFVIIGRIYDNITLNTFLSLQRLTKKLNLTDRVKFLPEASRLEVKKTLKIAKVYLHTSVGEHFGISIAEAMAMGCIPIVHDSGGPREFVPEELRYKSINGAAEKITKEINVWSPQKALKMVKIAEKFKEENFCNNFIRFFNRYIEETSIKRET